MPSVAASRAGRADPSLSLFQLIFDWVLMWTRARSHWADDFDPSISLCSLVPTARAIGASENRPLMCAHCALVNTQSLFLFGLFLWQGRSVCWDTFGRCSMDRGFKKSIGKVSDFLPCTSKKHPFTRMQFELLSFLHPCDENREKRVCCDVRCQSLLVNGNGATKRGIFYHEWLTYWAYDVCMRVTCWAEMPSWIGKYLTTNLKSKFPFIGAQTNHAFNSKHGPLSWFDAQK